MGGQRERSPNSVPSNPNVKTHVKESGSFRQVVDVNPGRNLPDDAPRIDEAGIQSVREAIKKAKPLRKERFRRRR